MAKTVEGVNTHPAPIARFETTHGAVTIKTAVYRQTGIPDDVAIATARREAVHRAEQLDTRR